MAWNNSVVTNSGVALLQQVLAGGTLTIDGAAGGTGTVLPGVLMAQTSLKNQKQAFSVVGATNVTNGKKVNILVSNADLSTGYTMQQVGIWAHVGEGSSVLFAILQDDTGIAIPSESDIPDFALNFYAVVDFSNESDFALAVDPSALVSFGMLTEAVSDAINEAKGYTDSVVATIDISSKLDKTGNGSDVTAAFTQAETRTNIATGEKLSVLFGKIKKWFADLGSAAFKDVGVVGGVAGHDALTSHLADYTLQVPYAVTTGSANTYAATLNPAITAYVAGMAICIKINVANTGASTLNVNSKGAKSILDSKGNAITSGKLRINGVYTLRYDGTNFILQGEGGSGNATAPDLLSGKTASTDAGDIVGTMANKGTAIYTPNDTTQSGTAGYYGGITVNPVPSSYKHFATGIITAVGGYTTIGGLAFNPSHALVITENTSNTKQDYLISITKDPIQRFIQNGTSYYCGIEIQHDEAGNLTDSYTSSGYPYNVISGNSIIVVAMLNPTPLRWYAWLV